MANFSIALMPLAALISACSIQPPEPPTPRLFSTGTGLSSSSDHAPVSPAPPSSTSDTSPAAIVAAAIKEPLTPEETRGLIAEMGSNWLYGNGVGESALTAGTIFMFPPYALYALGNAILAISGQPELRVTNALPDELRQDYNSFYESVTAAPGHFTAAVAGREFRNREVAKERLQPYLPASDARDVTKGAATAALALPGQS